MDEKMKSGIRTYLWMAACLVLIATVWVQFTKGSGEAALYESLISRIGSLEGQVSRIEEVLYGSKPSPQQGTKIYVSIDDTEPGHSPLAKKYAEREVTRTITLTGEADAYFQRQPIRLSHFGRGALEIYEFVNVPKNQPLKLTIENARDLGWGFHLAVSKAPPVEGRLQKSELLPSGHPERCNVGDVTDTEVKSDVFKNAKRIRIPISPIQD